MLHFDIGAFYSNQVWEHDTNWAMIMPYLCRDWNVMLELNMIKTQVILHPPALTYSLPPLMFVIIPWSEKGTSKLPDTLWCWVVLYCNIPYLLLFLQLLIIIVLIIIKLLLTRNCFTLCFSVEDFLSERGSFCSIIYFCRFSRVAH